MSDEGPKRDKWFDRMFKGVPADFPPPCKVALDKEHTVFFLEDHPREVIAGYKRPTMVIQRGLSPTCVEHGRGVQNSERNHDQDDQETRAGTKLPVSSGQGVGIAEKRGRRADRIDPRPATF
jgi:hypothetical protein